MPARLTAWARALPGRLAAWLKAVPGRAWTWLKSARGRAVWGRLLLCAVLIPAAPYLTVLWRIMLSGSATDQMVIVYAAAVILVLKSMRRRLKALDAEEDAGDGRADGPRRRPSGRSRKRGAR